MASPAAADPGAGFAVTVADLASTSAAFARHHARAADATVTANRSLAATAGMAGDDPVQAAWRGRYDAVAAITWLSAGAMASSLHGIAVLLVDTANSYEAAEHQADPRRRGAPDTLARPGGPTRLPVGPPSCTGPTGNEAPPELAEYWPGGDPARLRAAAAAWSALARQLDDAAYGADAAFRTLLAHNRGATFSAMGAFWARRFAPDGFDPLYNAVPRTARILGTTCDALADLVDAARHDMSNAVTDALHDTAGSEALARIPAGGLTAVAARVVGLLAPPIVASGYVRIARDHYLVDLQELTDRLGPDLEDRLRRALTTEVPPRPEDDPRHDPQLGLRSDDVGDVLTAGLTGTPWDDVDGVHPSPDRIHVEPKDRVHILDGDETGGGHRPGAGVAGKTEFPPGWSDPQILDAVLSVARAPDPQTDPFLGENGNWAVEGTRNGIRIRVFVDPDGAIWSAHPLGGPGVATNPR